MGAAALLKPLTCRFMYAAFEVAGFRFYFSGNFRDEAVIGCRVIHM